MANTAGHRLRVGAPQHWYEGVVGRLDWRHAGSLIYRGAIAVAAFTASMVVVQLLYPVNRSLPQSEFAGQNLGFMTQSKLESQLSVVNSTNFDFRASKASYKESLTSIGLGIDSRVIAGQLADYPFWQRLKPFSVFTYKPKVTSTGIAVTNELSFSKFVERVAKENNRSPVEGSIALVNDKFEAKAPVYGVSYNAQNFISYFGAMSNSSLASSTILPYDTVLSQTTHEELKELSSSANELIARKQKVSYGGSSVTIKPGFLSGALRFSPNPTTNKLQMSIDSSALAAGLEDLIDATFIAPTVSSVGQELDVIATAEAIKSAVQNGSAEAQAIMKPIAASAATLYPATSKGLTQLILDWNQSHPGGDIAVQFDDIGGMGRHAEYRPNDQYFSASVYKALVAWMILSKIDKAEIGRDGVVAAGMNLDRCFQEMIVVSGSVCAESWVHSHGGWPGLDQFVAEGGITGIAMSKGLKITADGMEQFLRKLNAGELMSQSSTKYLLDHMKRQMWRQGIPAGSAGEVADKVGYHAGAWHDAAIVYHPKGTYTLVILARGADLHHIKDLSRRISDTLMR
jgi:beta-lactamase class A